MFADFRGALEERVILTARSLRRKDPDNTSDLNADARCPTRMLKLALPASGESAAGFFDTSVAEALAEFEGGSEALAAQFAFAKLQVREATKVETVRLSPGILTIRVF
jgi:hypothetical protein